MSSEHEDLKHPKDKEDKSNKTEKKAKKETAIKITRSFNETGKPFHELMKDIFIYLMDM
ncbi:hypothetical protein [Acetivibrio cellulolyticus]|uniref:hypothetical protein n=1 Tax=Acetivibrio cellulolyticus TaxID=35830 RepID=UPI0001E2BA63|nr:hypothetical protein [Acetivibrio cellulolyticus]